MNLFQPGHRTVGLASVGLEQQACFARLGDLPIPGEDRSHGPNRIAAGDEVLVDQLPGERDGGILVRARAPDKRAHRRRPTMCRPHAVAMTSSAPTNWCAVATHSDTPVHTVAIPSTICTPNALAGGVLVPVPGGVLIRDDSGEIVGAVGITGDTSDNDEACAVAGIEAVGLKADPG